MLVPIIAGVLFFAWFQTTFYLFSIGWFDDRQFKSKNKKIC